jgi:voltage-gated potassium channel
VKFPGRFGRLIIAMALVVASGTVGYALIERWSWFDALYMTVVTISTVGYQEVHPLDQAGRVFTIFVILGGTGTLLYAATTIAQYVVEGQLGTLMGRRRMRESIARLKDHTVLCGYGKVGQEVARVFRGEGVPFVVVESDINAFQKCSADGHLCVHGDATVDETLEEAGIKSAKSLVAALATDADNLYLTMTAKSLRPDLFIVARVYNEESEPKLRRAGASRTMSPYHVGGRRLAMMTLRPLVVDFIDTAMGSQGRRLVFEDIELRAGSVMVGQTTGTCLQACGGAQILAVKKKDGRLIANPPPDTKLEVGDEVVVAGTREQLKLIDPLLQAKL